jgi:hypothetical protein
MSRLLRAAIGLCLLIATSAGVAAQSRHGGATTLYFIRPDGLIAPWAPDIKVDGQIVGELRAGTYIAVSRRPGRHALEVKGGGLDTGFTSELDFAAGRSYFFQVGTMPSGPYSHPGLSNMLLGGISGTRVAGRGFMPNYTFFQVDAASGAAQIARLRRVDSR